MYVGKVIVSLERAYHMFLSNETNSINAPNNDKLTQNEYIVYSHFMRFGCNLRRFKNEHVSHSDSDKKTDPNAKFDKDDVKPYIWNYLYELLGQRKATNAPRNLVQSRYTNIKQSMNRTISGFRNVDSLTTNANDCVAGTSGKVSIPEKRKLHEGCGSADAPIAKLPKLMNNSSDQYLGSGSTNDFMVDGTIQKFKHIFDKIDIIELKTSNFDDKQPCSSNERFSFDLWTSLDHRHAGPNFRLIIK